jgi:hypothetical protein
MITIATISIDCIRAVVVVIFIDISIMTIISITLNTIYHHHLDALVHGHARLVPGDVSLGAVEAEGRERLGEPIPWD